MLADVFTFSGVVNPLPPVLALDASDNSESICMWVFRTRPSTGSIHASPFTGMSFPLDVLMMVGLCASSYLTFHTRSPPT